MVTIMPTKMCFLALVVSLAADQSASAQSFDKAALTWTLPWDADWVTSVAFIDNERLAAGNNLGDILVWKLPEQADKTLPPPVQRLMGHTNTVDRLMTTPDRRWLISASNDHTVTYWDMQGETSEIGTVMLNARARSEAEAKKKKLPDAVEHKV